MLEIRQIGYEKCLPSHGFGPAVRDMYLLHFIKSGKGRFYYQDLNGDQNVEVIEGQGFLIYPDELTYYEADSVNPWAYSWLGFRHQEARVVLDELGLSQQQRVVYLNKANQIKVHQTLETLSLKKLLFESDRLYELGRVSLLLSDLMSQKSQAAEKQLEDKSIESNSSDINGSVSKELLTEKGVRYEQRYFEAAKAYLNRRYIFPLTIDEVALHVGIDRTYLYRIFLAYEGKGPKDYLMTLRMRRAQELLLETTLRIKEIAYSVGYQDPYLFSKMYKTYWNKAPKQERDL